MKVRALILTLLPLAVATIANGAEPFAKAQIPFAFMVEGKMLPAGAYTFNLDSAAGTVLVRGTDKGGQDAFAVVLTRLAPPAHSTVTDADLVFDVVGDNYTLSEIRFPGADGVLVYATKGPHQHQVVHSPR